MFSLRLTVHNPDIFFCQGKKHKDLNSNFDKLVKSRKAPVVVIPANAGIQEIRVFMDPRSPIGVEDKLRGGDGLGDFLRDHQYSIFNIQFSIQKAIQYGSWALPLL